MSTAIPGVDVNGELPIDVNDYINAKIYSMLGDCTEDSLRQYQLEMAQKSVLRLQQEVRELQCKLQVQAVQYEKAKEEASMNATALKTSIANCQKLKERLKKWMQKGMLLKSCPEQSRELVCNVRQGKSLGNTELQLGGSSSGDHTMDVYGDGNTIPRKRAAITNEGLKVHERQYPRKRLLQKLDLNVEDSNYSLVSSLPSMKSIKVPRPPRKEVKQLNTPEACQQNLSKVVEVEADERHSFQKLDFGPRDWRKELKHPSTTEKTCERGLPRAEIEVGTSTDSINYFSPKAVRVNVQERRARFFRDLETDDKHCTRKKPLRVLDLNAEDSKYRQKTPAPSSNCLKSPEIQRKKVELLNSKVEICQQDDLKVDTQDSVISVKDQNHLQSSLGLGLKSES